MGDLFQDIRYGTRTLAQRPLFTLAAVLALGLAVGANTSIFSLFNAAFLQPLPFAQPERLVRVYEALPQAGFFQVNTSVPVIRDWKERGRAFERISPLWNRSFALSGGNEPRYIRATSVSAEFFELLGVEPFIGRGFLPQEQEPGSEKAAVLSFALWQSLFGGSPDVLEDTIRLDGEVYTIVGVLPRQVKYPPGADMWVPAVFPDERVDRGYTFLSAIARIHPGLTLEQAQSEMTALAGQLAQEYPQHQGGRTTNLVGLRESLAGDRRRPLMLLLGAVGLVLLIACANTANLLLARSAVRGREMAVRTALGAGRGRLIRQLLTESLLLAGSGGAMGLLLAWMGAGVMAAWLPSSIAGTEAPLLDWRVLGFCLAVSAATGLLFGLAPAVQVSRPSLQGLREGSRSESTSWARSNRLRSLLIVGEVALSAILLIGAGLLLRSLSLALPNDPGFPTEDLVALQIRLPEFRYPVAAQQIGFFQDLLERVKGPQVRSAAAMSPLLFNGSRGSSFRMEDGENRELTSYRIVTPGFFRTLGLALIQGRDFSWSDSQASTPVAIVNQAFVQRHLQGQTALGRRIQPHSSEFRTIVGVAADIRYTGLGQAEAEMYFPFSQSPEGSLTLLVRSDVGLKPLTEFLRSQIWSIDPEQPIRRIRPMDEVIPASESRRRFLAQALSAFAGLATVLALVGVYGLLSFLVTQRTREIGLRMACGAQSRDALLLILRRGMGLTLAGLALGLLGASWLSRFLSSQLYGIGPTDAWTFAAVSLLVLPAALVACSLPALHASRLDPVDALRCE